MTAASNDIRVWLNTIVKKVRACASRRGLEAVRVRLGTPTGAAIGVALGFAFGVGIGLTLPHAGDHGKQLPKRSREMAVAIEWPAQKAAVLPTFRSTPLSTLPTQHDLVPQPTDNQTPPAATIGNMTTPNGTVQQSTPSGVPPWRRYAVAVPPTDGKPMVAIDIDDMGVDLHETAIAMKLLPPAVTFAFLPYGPDIRTQVDEARRLGHEILVHVPMQPDDPRIDPGPMALKVDQTPAQILHRLGWDLDRFSGYVGINNHMGSRFTSDAAAMRVVMREVKARRLMYMDSETIASSVGYRMAKAFHVPALRRDMFLDDVPTKEKVLAQLAKTVRYAHLHGSVIAIGHPRPGTLAALKAWLPTVAKAGVVLVPLTALLPMPPKTAAQDVAKMGTE